MHILLIHQAYVALDEAGGTRHAEMAHLMAERGHQVTIIASPVSYLTGKTKNNHQRWLEREQPDANITVLRVFTYAALHRSFVTRVFVFLSFMVSSFYAGLRTHKVDLVWGTSPPIFQGFTAWLLAWLKGSKFLFEVRDLWPDFAIAVGVLKNSLLINLSKWLEGFLYKRADRLVVNSPGFIEHIRSKGIQRIDLIPNGADPEMFAPDLKGEEFRTSHGLAGKFVVMYAGAHGLSNDLEIVLDAAILLRGRADIQFVLVGDGKEKPSLLAKTQANQLANITFVDPIPKNKIAGVMAAADACIAILKPIEMYKTTYPNKVFDYMAAGRPVILAIEGVIREVLEKHEAGIAVKPGDAHGIVNAVLQLADDPERCAEMGRAGRQAVINFYNRDKFAQQMITLLEEMR